MSNARLDPTTRRATLDAMAQRQYDLIVIGGGITGVGTALDAVARGMTVALLEAGDLAAGTSSRSGKVFHGGLRYLEQLNLSLVREALKERDLMVDRLCPHLVSPEKFTFPFTSRWQRPYIGAGVLLYDLLRLTGTRSVKGHRHLSRAGTLRELAALRPDVVKGGVQYYDVRVDDARHTMMVARTAAFLGADVSSHTPVIEVTRDGGRVTGVRARDTETGEEFTVTGRAVVSATGVWAEEVQELAGEHTLSVTAAKGIHLVIPGDRIDADSGLIARTSDSVFIIRRWFDYWLMGTTDTKWEHERGTPIATKSDIDYLLGHANRWLATPLTRDDVVGVYAGLRPLISGKGDSTAKLSRDHAVAPGPDGMFTVVGGKYTTYRIMARDAVDAVAAHLDADVPKSATERLPILGAEGYRVLWRRRKVLAAQSGLDTAWIEHLLGRYGSLTLDILHLIEEHPDLGKPLPEAPGYLAAELHYAASHEGAMHLDDVLVRRTRVFMETPDAGAAAAEPAARIVGQVLGWDADRQSAEVDGYRSQREAERRAARELTDADAVSAKDSR